MDFRIVFEEGDFLEVHVDEDRDDVSSFVPDVGGTGPPFVKFSASLPGPYVFASVRIQTRIHGGEVRGVAHSDVQVV